MKTTKWLPSPCCKSYLPVLFALVAISLPGYLLAADEMSFDSGKHRVTLIELFTSQGCSSCPPAERWMGNLKDHPLLWKELVPVAFHVDYWDYLGWKDKLADPMFAKRQAHYRRDGNISSVYTPGLVVNGKEWRGWFRKQSMPSDEGKTGRLSVDIQHGTLQATYRSATPDTETLSLNLAVLGTGISEIVSAGENHGKTLPQDFSVLSHRIIRSEDGRWETGFIPPAAPAGSQLALAAWVSRIDNQAPLQATGGWLSNSARDGNE
ncbi:MAG: DUF1223 domain-containing protein [Gammaproteobacteria bacterium]|nr:DUF1223 domain-containing protein [Gammaproteobacteria bacterium]